MVVVSVQVIMLLLFTRRVMDSPPAVPRARTVMLLVPPPVLELELDELELLLLLEDEELLLEPEGATARPVAGSILPGHRPLDRRLDAICGMALLVFAGPSCIRMTWPFCS